MAHTDPWLLPSAAPQQAAPKQPAQPTDRGVVIPNPRARQEQRAEESQAMEAERLGLSQAGEARAGREEIRGSARELRSEFNGLDPVRDYQKALPNYVAALKTQETGTGDLALVYYFAKTIDPGSAVQQGEMDNIQATDSRLPALAQKALRELRLANGKFTKEARDGLRRELQGIIAQRNQAYNSERDRYSQIASSPEYGVDPEIVIGPHFGQRFYNDIDEYWKSKAPPPPAAGGEGGPAVSVSPEESISTFGQLTYDKDGNLVGRAYQRAGGTIYDAQGNELGLTGAVSAEELAKPADSFFGGIARDVGEAITGSERATPTTEALPDWVEMPELQQLLSVPSFKTALGTAFGGGPQEIAQIVQSNFPETKVFQDEKGNYILQSPSTGKQYAIKPGFQLSDVPRAISIILAGAGGRGATVGQTALREGLVQTGIEATQASVGGTFNPEDVAAAAVIGAGGKKLEEVLPPVVQGVRDLRRGGVGPAGGGMAPAPTAPIETPPSLPGGIALPGGRVTEAPVAVPPVTEAPPVAAPGVSGRVFEAGEGAPGMRGGGAAQLDEAAIRAQRAAELPVPIELARFQRTRNFAEQQRARELAKNNEVGGPIRDRMAQQQDALRQNFERFIEGTGSQVWENPYEQGGVIADALSTLAKRERTKINALYKRAERAGEMRDPVSYQALSDFINAQTPTTREKLAPVLRSVQEQLAAADPNKTGMVTLNQMEDIRKLINKVASPGTPDSSFGRDMRGIIDDATKDAGGDVYRQARAARAKYARDFDDIDLVQKIYSTKPGSTERYVALEKVVDRITGGSAPLDSVNSLLNLLDRAGPRGARAKRELQGAVMEKIRDQAYRGVTRDESGGVVIQPAALNTIITQLDKAGKLDAIFDKKTAELLRTVNDVTKDIVTAPPGSVNASGTSSAIMNAIDTVATFGTTGIPVPAAKILNEFRKALANRSMRKEVKRLLD